MGTGGHPLGHTHPPADGSELVGAWLVSRKRSRLHRRLQHQLDPATEPGAVRRLRYSGAGGSKKEPKGRYYSTSADVLENAQGQHSGRQHILDQPEIGKLLRDYVETPRLVNPVHRYTSTRLSIRPGGPSPGASRRATRSAGTSLYVPSGAARAQALVATVVADDQRRLLLVELRCGASVPGPALIEAFRVTDIPRTNGRRRVWHGLRRVSLDAQLCKRVNFAPAVGNVELSPRSGTECPRRCRPVRAPYFDRFSRGRKSISERQRQAAQRGYVRIDGSTALFPHPRAGPGRTSAIRKLPPSGAINMPVRARQRHHEGSHAPACTTLAPGRIRARLLLQVHDNWFSSRPRTVVPGGAAGARTDCPKPTRLVVPAEQWT